MDRHDSDLIEDLLFIVDKNAPAPTETVDVTEGPPDAVQSMLKRRFQADSALSRVLLTVKGRPVGPVTRESLGASLRTAGRRSIEPYEVGDGERITLPGDSTRYRLLKFACPQCESGAHRLFHDDRDFPSCTAHGVMEFLG